VLSLATAAAFVIASARLNSKVRGRFCKEVFVCSIVPRISRILPSSTSRDGATGEASLSDDDLARITELSLETAYYARDSLIYSLNTLAQFAPHSPNSIEGCLVVW
jgi:hypothetical protein